MGKELTKIEYFFSRSDTIVFWNLEQHPIPNTADPKSPDFRSIHPNFITALHQMGFHGSVDIQVYGNKQNHDTGELFDAGISYLEEEDMSLDIITCARASSPPLNIVVIAKPNPETRELYRVLQCLKSRKYNVLLVEPPDGITADRVFQSVESIVDCTQVLGWGKPKSKKSDDDAHFEGVCSYY